MKKLYHFQPKKVDNSLLSAKVLDLAVDMLHDFSKRQLRAELQATQKVLGTLRWIRQKSALTIGGAVVVLH